MTTRQPLAGFVAVEIGHSIAAPYAGMILAELGMEVIKVENPDGGDAARGWGPPFVEGAGPHFKAFNRNKRSISVDLADKAQVAQLSQLILDRADVVLCNLRAGVADRYELGAKALIPKKPELIYCDVGAFGSGGPMSHRPGYDPLMQAFGGIMSVTGENESRPPIRVGVSMIDMGTGMWSVIGIMGALLERKQSGRGGHLETSLFETALAWAAVPITRHLMGAGPQKPQGSGAAGIVPYQAFRTRDGWLVIGAGNDRLFASLAKVMSKPELAQDPRFMKNGGRVTNQSELLPLIEAFAAGYTSGALGELLDAEGIPNAPVQTIAQVVDNPQTVAVSMVQKPDGLTPTVGLPLRFDGQRPEYRTEAPPLGKAAAAFED